MKISAKPALVVVLAGALGGCAITRLSATGGETVLVTDDLVRAVAFDHGCGPDRITVLRRDLSDYDLNVCGKVRRYKGFGDKAPRTWLDVTGLYPAASLPTLGQGP